MRLDLIETNGDTNILVDGLLDDFKEHLRILHPGEDGIIKLYLSAAIGSIEAYADRDINLASYKAFYPTGFKDYTYPGTMNHWHTGKKNISNLKIVNSAGVDVTNKFECNCKAGTIYPHPSGLEVAFDSGFATKDEVPDNLKMILFRYGAALYEERQSIRAGKPNELPDWVNYMLASVWNPRV